VSSENHAIVGELRTAVAVHHYHHTYWEDISTPLTLSVGLTKKHGLPNYGSVGASCHLELELDGSLLHGDLDGFHRHVRNAFFSCRQAVHDELARHQEDDTSLVPVNSHHGNGERAHGARRSTRTSVRRATANQISALEAIAQRQQLDLANLLSERFGAVAAEDLSITQASQLIDELKAPAANNGDSHEG